MSMEERSKSHGAVTVFFLGLVVGICVALLFTTKKGRRILKTLTDQGLEKMSDVEKLLEDEAKTVKENVADIHVHAMPDIQKEIDEELGMQHDLPQTITITPKRFFKGIRKKLN